MNYQLKNLKDVFKAGKGAHAYLFAGAGGGDKKEAALAFAREATGFGEGAFNPDLMLVGVEEGERGISIAQIREIKNFLSLTPHGGKNRAVIVDEFEKMKPEASSAILKILEEPPPNSVLILISDYPAMILPTILSRAQRINFSNDAEISVADIDKRKEIFYTLISLILSNTAEKLNKIEDLCKKDENDDIFEYWLSFFRDLGCLSAGCEDCAVNAFYIKEMKSVLVEKRYAPSQIADIISELLHWSYLAKTTNVNKRLVLENIALII